MDIYQWAARHGVSSQAMQELTDMFVPNSPASGQTEGAIQQQIRLSGSHSGHRLWRNNNGACKDDGGRQIRFGLGNDSARINKHFKSSDLIGITSMIIQPHHIGRLVGIFTAVEVKRGSWKWSGDEREQAQLKYLNVVAAAGGIGTFAKSKEDYEQCLINATA